MRQLGKYSNQQESKSLKYVAREYKETYLDGSFQRYGGIERGSGWSEKFSQEFLGSLLENATSNSIIRAGVKRCLEHAKELLEKADTQENKFNVEYWEKIKKLNLKYVSIDGNNSSSSINGFVQNKITAIQHEDGGETNEIKLGDYKKGSERYDEILIEEKMTVNTLSEITINEMCALFRKINRSTSLNDQEYRNAHPSPVSNFVRDLANQDRDVWKMCLSSKELELGAEKFFDKRTHEHYLAMYLTKVKSNYAHDCTKAPIDLMYEKNNSLSSEEKKRVRSTVELFGKISKALAGAKVSKSKVQALLDLCDHILQEGLYVIKDHAAFGNWFLCTDAHFMRESAEIPMDEYQYTRAYQRFLSKHLTAPQYKRINCLFAEALGASIESLKNEGIIADAPKPRKKSDLFSRAQKLILWSLQGAIGRNGKNIEILGIYLGKYEADHVVSVKDGGQTNFGNGEIMPKEDNRSKGSKSNEPHFPHQKIEEEQYYEDEDEDLEDIGEGE